MDTREAIRRVVYGGELTEAEMVSVMEEIMTGRAEPAAMASLITALAMRGETVAEITGAARVMREHATHVEAPAGPVVDTCGTGGDSAATFNISTASAFVAAGAGLMVAKHGGRAVTSRCGSADVLRALGVNIEATAGRMEECLREAGMAFLFAPTLHGAMRHAAPVRRALGIRTIFNILGPLTNPAGARRQLLGVFSAHLTEVMARVLRNLGSERALVVHGEDGLDELTTTERTRVSELGEDGEIRTYYIGPEDVGLMRASAEDLRGGEPEENASIILEVLRGVGGPRRDIVVLNSAAAITAGGRCRTIRDGCALAEEAIDSGAALERLRRLVEVSNRR